MREEFLILIVAVAFLALAAWWAGTHHEKFEQLKSGVREAFNVALEEVAEEFEKSDSVVCQRDGTLALLEDFRVVRDGDEIFVVGSNRWYDSRDCYRVIRRERGKFRALLETGEVLSVRERILLQKREFSPCTAKVDRPALAVRCCLNGENLSKKSAEEDPRKFLKECFLSSETEKREAALLESGAVVFAKSVILLQEKMESKGGSRLEAVSRSARLGISEDSSSEEQK